ncbi:hypothetical protein RP20_CCG009552 [Aedes albopictus]|nr:hypothetical protein RP20_CCG009552 [Aedes albopictus]
MVVKNGKVGHEQNSKRGRGGDREQAGIPQGIFREKTKAAEQHCEKKHSSTPVRIAVDRTEPAYSEEHFSCTWHRQWESTTNHQQHQRTLGAPVTATRNGSGLDRSSSETTLSSSRTGRIKNLLTRETILQTDPGFLEAASTTRSSVRIIRQGVIEFHEPPPSLGHGGETQLLASNDHYCQAAGEHWPPKGIGALGREE